MERPTKRPTNGRALAPRAKRRPSKKRGVDPNDLLQSRLAKYSLKTIARVLRRARRARRDDILEYLRQGSLIASVCWPDPAVHREIPSRFWHEFDIDDLRVVRVRKGKAKYYDQKVSAAALGDFLRRVLSELVQACEKQDLSAIDRPTLDRLGLNTDVYVGADRTVDYSGLAAEAKKRMAALAGWPSKALSVCVTLDNWLTFHRSLGYGSAMSKGGRPPKTARDEVWCEALSELAKHGQLALHLLPSQDQVKTTLSSRLGPSKDITPSLIERIVEQAYRALGRYHSRG